MLFTFQGQKAFDITGEEKLLDVTALSEVKSAVKFLHEINFKVERVSRHSNSSSLLMKHACA